LSKIIIIFPRYNNDVNDVFGLLLASNLFITASLLCCVAYYSVVQGFNMEGFSYMMLFMSVTAQFYMVSLHGQMLIDFVGKTFNIGSLSNIPFSEYQNI